MKNEDILNITTLEQAVAAALEISADKKALDELNACMKSLNARLDELVAYSEQLISSAEAALNAWFTADEYERVRLHAKATELRNEAGKVPAILRAMQGYVDELKKRSDAIQAKYD